MAKEIQDLDKSSPDDSSNLNNSTNDISVENTSNSNSKKKNRVTVTYHGKEYVIHNIKIVGK